MRCPSCGARNAASAEWCTLCYAPLREAPPAAAPTAEPAPAERPSVERPAAEAAATSSDGRFRRTGEGLDWRCGTCDTWNPIERQTCVTCREPFTRTLAPDQDEPRPEVNGTTAVGATILLPGSGHVMLGQGPAGALRIILYVIWLGGGIVLLLAAARSGQPILPAVPLLLGALVVLFASVIEVQRTVSDDDTILLTPRVTLWLVVGVLGALMVSFLAAAMAVTP